VRRVVITGTGAVSPYGVSVGTLMENLFANRTAVRSMREQWEPKIRDLSCWVGAPVMEPLDPKSIPRKFRRGMGPTAIMALLASQEAIGHARIPESAFSSGRMGVSFASTTGSALSMEQFFMEYFQKAEIKNLPSGIFFQIMSHTAAANIAYAYNICGRVISPNAACASSSQAIGLGFEAIQQGHQDIMLCGGADELHPVVSACFDLVHACSYKYNDEPTRTPRPFDRDRDGTVCGEGAGAVILESEESALQRGTPILAEILGFATMADGTHMAESHTQSVKFCMKRAIENAHGEPGDIEYINAHATGTEVGDRAEAEAIRELFGDHAVPVSGFKGYLGHTLGASGVLELIICLKMLDQGRIIPTRNLDNPGEGCEGIHHVIALEERKIKTFVKNNFAFGGINSVLVLRR